MKLSVAYLSLTLILMTFATTAYSATVSKSDIETINEYFKPANQNARDVISHLSKCINAGHFKNQKLENIDSELIQTYRADGLYRVTTVRFVDRVTGKPNEFKVSDYARDEGDHNVYFQSCN